MNIEERVAHHKRMAQSYAQTYLRQAVQEGERYEAWTFASDATFASPYFTGEGVLIPLAATPADAGKVATMEAKAYALKFPDWKPAKFDYWAADNGFAMKTRWEGHAEDGTTMGFYSYGYVTTNEAGEIAHWETHVNDEYNAFLDYVIGVHGPFHGHSEYVQALVKTLTEAGVPLG